MKNAIFVRLMEPLAVSWSQLEEAMSKNMHREPTAYEYSRTGYVPPLGNGGDLLEQIDTNIWMIAIRTSRRDLPSAVIAKHLARRVDKFERDNDRPIGKVEKIQLKERLVNELLPKAFVKDATTVAIITSDYIIVDATSDKRAEQLLDELRHTIGSLKVIFASTSEPPEKAMTRWLRQEHTDNHELIIGDGHLKLETKETGFACRNVQPFGHEVKTILETEHRVTEMQLCHEDCIMRLNDSFQLRAIKWFDHVKQQAEADAGEDDDPLTINRTSAFIYTHTLIRIMEMLRTSMGGWGAEMVVEQEAGPRKCWVYHPESEAVFYGDTDDMAEGADELTEAEANTHLVNLDQLPPGYRVKVTEDGQFEVHSSIGYVTFEPTLEQALEAAREDHEELV